MNNEQVKTKEKRPVAFTALKYTIAAVLIVLLAYFGYTCEVR